MSNIQGISASMYNMGEQQLHKAAQILALTGDSFLATLPDESQSTLNVNSLANRLEARKFSIKGLNYKLSINIAEFALELSDDQQNILQSKSFISSTYGEMQTAWRQWFKGLGVEQELSTTLRYELSPVIKQLDAFNELPEEFANVWYDNRLSAVRYLNELSQLTGVDSEINIWPHHFDTGVYYSFNQHAKEAVFAIGAGLAVADDLVEEPYYYIYGYSSDGLISYDKAPALTNGSWLTEGWQGAVLPLSELEAAYSNQVNVFFGQTANYLLRFKKAHK